MNHDPLLIQGIEEFNNQKFFDAHETLEEYWRTLQGDEKELVQSIIQAAVAYYHFFRENKTGAKKLLARAVSRAESVKPNTLDIDVSAYLMSIRNSLEAVESQDLSIEIARVCFKT